MIPITLGEAAAAAAGRLLDADPEASATGIGVDSRALTAGDLFVGLPGEHADGASFAPAALAAGAVAAVVTPRAGAAYARIEVADPLAALAAIAGAVRERSQAAVVGITGSVGKTITKDLLASALATRLRVVASRRSFNNEIGLPLTLARLEPDTDALVVEMGARGAGHIRELCATARPDVGVVTNVGTAHYELFGSQAAIADAKGELPEALPAHGSAILNADDPLVAAMAARTRAKVITFALQAEAHVRAAAVRLDEAGRPRFRLLTPDGAAETVLPLPGEHLVPDALAAAAAAWALGIGPDDIAAGLADAELSPMRMQVLRRGDGVTVVNDAYNANPASMAAGLKALRAARRPGGRTVAVLGGMAELGAIAEEEHDRIGRLVVRLGVDRLVGVGPLGHLIVRAARLEGIWEPDDARMVETVDEAVAAVGQLGPDDVVLVKASRAIGLDRVADALMAEHALAAPGEGVAG